MKNTPLSHILSVQSRTKMCFSNTRSSRMFIFTVMKGQPSDCSSRWDGLQWKVVERRPAPRRGFRDGCCPPTASHRLCGQWNVKLSTFRRLWRLVNRLFDSREQQLWEKFGWWAIMRDSGHTVMSRDGRAVNNNNRDDRLNGFLELRRHCATLHELCVQSGYWLPWIFCRLSCDRSVACSWTWCVCVLCETGPLGDKWTCWPGGTSGRCIIVLIKRRYR